MNGAAAASAPALRLDLAAVRRDFPILERRVHGQPLAYLDSAASSQRPRAVTLAIQEFEATSYANVHRGVHTLSQEATAAYEAARATVAEFLGAGSPDEVVFTSGTTESINLVAQSWGRSFLSAGDEVLVSALEHHSNLVPWQVVCAERGARLRVLPIDQAGDLRLDQAARLISPRTRLLALTQVSHVLGTVTPVRELAALVHASGGLVLVDGAQAAAHDAISVAPGGRVDGLDCDFYAFSGHMVYGPSGIGAWWGRSELLAAMPPWQTGGGMISSVSFERTEYQAPPQRFEAGTPNIVGAVGLAAALRYLQAIGRERAIDHGHGLLELARRRLAELPGVRVLGAPERRAAVVSFLVDGVHPHDVGTVLDRAGIAVRVGHHCAQPLMDLLGIPGTVRASFACYNTEDEVERLVAAVPGAQRLFGRLA